MSDDRKRYHLYRCPRCGVVYALETEGKCTPCGRIVEQLFPDTTFYTNSIAHRMGHDLGREPTRKDLEEWHQSKK